MTLTGTEVRATARIQLLLHTINVPKHPKLDDLLAISGEEGSASPSDLSASWLHFKESTAVQPLEHHARRRAVAGKWEGEAAVGGLRRVLTPLLGSFSSLQTDSSPGPV